MKVAFVASEVVPFAKTGGLADVAGSLPKEIANLGHDVKVFMPKYYSIDEYKFDLKYLDSIGEMQIRVGGIPRPVHVHKGFLPDSNTEVYFIDYSFHFHRHQIYTNDHDEDERFILFSKAVIEVFQRLGWAPDIVNCNDWQTGLIPFYLKENYSWDRMFDKTACVFTIHNIGYQGRFSKDTLDNGEIDHKFFYPGGPVEFHDSVSFLKTGIVFSELVNTVSETYAAELLTPEYSAGMHDVLLSRKNDFLGILNGVDYSIWNPKTDKYLPHHYDENDLSGKLLNKKFLLQHVGLPFDENKPLIGIISRLAIQKGFDIIAKSIYDLMELDAQWVILGSGEPKYEHLFRSMAYMHPNQTAVYIGYNNELAHLIEAGADIFLMPSHYEPCGLNQIYSLKYGTVPVVRKTGGLADTVQDWNEFNELGLDTGNGYSFYEYSGAALIHSVKRAINDFKNKPVWEKIQINGMMKNYSWKRSAEKYVDMYNLAIEKRRV